MHLLFIVLRVILQPSKCRLCLVFSTVHSSLEAMEESDTLTAFLLLLEGSTKGFVVNVSPCCCTASSLLVERSGSGGGGYP